MKIAHVLTRFSPEENPGGVERVVEELAKRQTEEHEVEVICRNQFNDDLEEEYKGFTIRRSDVLDFSGLRTLSSLLTMRKLIKRSDADIFHIHDWSPYMNYIAAGEPEKAVLTLHNREVGRAKLLQDLAISRADAVTVVSKDIQRRMDRKSKIIPNGVDLEQFAPQEPEDYYLFAGNLIKNKGVRELCSVWKKQWPELKIAGAGPEEKNIPDQENIEKLGEIPHQKMPDLIGRSIGLILPSRTEGFGLVWAEALASGKPVLATETGLGLEIPKYCGVKLDPEFRLDELEAELEGFLDQDFDTDRIRDYAEESFDWTVIARKTLDIYDQVRSSR